MAAIGVCLALSLTMTAVVLNAGTGLNAARRAYDRSQAEYALDADQALYANALALDPTRIDAEAPSATSGVMQSAEREAPKRSPGAAGAIPGAWLKSLGVRHPEVLKSALAGLANSPTSPTMTVIAAADPSPLWKRCAEEGVSPDGAAKASAAPIEGASPAGLPLIVRLLARSPAGWQDDRIVRLTSDPANRVVILDRRFSRTMGPVQPCPSAPKVAA